MRTRFTRLTDTGTRLEAVWVNKSACKVHKATSELRHGDDEDADASQIEDWQWPTSCDVCGEERGEDAILRIASVDVFDTESGMLEPGCVYWNSRFEDKYFWENHSGPHLTIVAPNGFKWVVDSQARNCRRPSNRHHRCWKWEGDPIMENLTVFYDDTTCKQGGGNLVTLGSWTGSLLDGEFIAAPTMSLTSRRAHA